jgi:hypothetical protein
MTLPVSQSVSQSVPARFRPVGPGLKRSYQPGAYQSLYRWRTAAYLLCCVVVWPGFQLPCQGPRDYTSRAQRGLTASLSYQTITCMCVTEDSIVIRPSPYNLLLAVVSVVHSFEFRPFTSSSLLVGTRLEHHVQHIQQLPVPRRTQCFREHVTALRVRGLLHNPVHRVRNSIPK